MKTTHYRIQVTKWKEGVDISETIKPPLQKALDRLEYLARREGLIKLDDSYTVQSQIAAEFRNRKCRIVSVSHTVNSEGVISISKEPNCYFGNLPTHIKAR